MNNQNCSESRDAQDILLGIDIGTSACKVAAFSLDGTVLAQTNESYEVHYPRAGWAEQDPNAWWEAVCRALRTLFDAGASAGVQPSRVRGVGIDGQSWSAVAVDKAGKVMCNTPIWMDTRAADICGRMKAQMGEDTLFATSGNPVQPMYTMPKVLWYQENCPEVYEKADKILQSNSFIVYRLTGALTQEPSQGYGWNCYDMARGRWNTALCEALGVRAQLLPDIMPSHAVAGTVTEQAARQTGLCMGTPVVAGGLDAACGTLGAGVVKPGQTQEQGGQAGGMSICLDTCKTDARLILGAHVVPGLWLLQGGTVGGGGAVNWFEREFCAAERVAAQQNGTSAFAEMDAGAAQIAPGSDGLVFLPYLAGERSPIWDANAKGVFYGADFSKTRAHFARAVMEGVAYSLRHNLEAAAQAGAQADVLCAMGGAANSRLWTQLKADVTGKRVTVPSADTATALGAAILAGVGTGVYPDFETAVQQTVQTRRTHAPNPATKDAYNAGYRVYRSLYENLKHMMNEVQP